MNAPSTAAASLGSNLATPVSWLNLLVRMTGQSERSSLASARPFSSAVARILCASRLTTHSASTVANTSLGDDATLACAVHTLLRRCLRYLAACVAGSGGSGVSAVYSNASCAVGGQSPRLPNPAADL